MSEHNSFETAVAAIGRNPPDVDAQCFGFHLLIDASACDPLRVGHQANLQEMITALADCIETDDNRDAIIEHLNADDRVGAACSLVRMSGSTSIAGHFIANGAVACMDVFSVRPFDVEAVRDIVERYLLPVSTRVTCVRRQT